MGKPFATSTPLGWMVPGPDDLQRTDREHALFVSRHNDEIDLNNLLRSFSTTESFGVTPSQTTLITKEDQRAREVVNTTMKRVGKR